MKNPDPNSNRSKRRANRGWISLEKSSRKHRRARKRSIISRTQYGRVGASGEKIGNGGSGFVHQCGGSIDYHST